MGVTVRELAWAAGLIEGEGNFGVRRRGNSISLVVQVSMTDYDVLLKLQEILGGQVTGPYIHREGNIKPNWHISRACRAAAVGMTLYTFFGERRQQQVRTMLDAWHEQRGHPSKRGYCK